MLGHYSIIFSVIRCRLAALCLTGCVILSLRGIIEFTIFGDRALVCDVPDVNADPEMSVNIYDVVNNAKNGYRKNEAKCNVNQLVLSGYVMNTFISKQPLQ